MDLYLMGLNFLMVIYGDLNGKNWIWPSISHGLTWFNMIDFQWDTPS